MANWMQRPTAKELIGMEPDELKSKLDAGATKADLEAVTAGQIELKNTLAAMTEAIAALKGNNAPPPAVEPGSGDDSLDILTDPKKFVNAQLAPVVASELETRAQVQEMRAHQNPKLSAVFEQYGEELLASASKWPAASRARDDFWASHIRMTLGDKMVKGEIREGNFPSLLGATTFGTDTGRGTGDPDQGIDKPVADFLRSRDVPLEKAKKIMTLMSQGEPISLATLGKVGNA